MRSKVKQGFGTSAATTGGWLVDLSMNFWMSEIDKSKYKDKYNVKYKDKDTNKGLASYYDYPLLSEKYPNIRLSLNIGYSVKGGAAVSVKGWGQCLTVTLSTQTFLNFYQIFDKHRDKKEEEEKKTKTMKINLSITITKWLTVTLSSQTFLNLS